MRKPASEAAVPIIEIFKRSGTWEVHWDYQEAEESLILSKRNDYLRGYINGSLDAIGIKPSCVCCASGLTGAVKRLDERSATMLHEALTRLLIPVVEAEFARLERVSKQVHAPSVTEEE